MRILILAALSTAFLLFAQACDGGGQEPTTTPSPAVARPSPTAEPTPEPTEEPTPTPGVTRPEPRTLVSSGYALDQALEVSLDGSDIGQIVIVSHTIRKDKVGNPVVGVLPQDCPSDPVAGSPCAFRVEVFTYDRTAGWVSRYLDDHGNQFAGAEQALRAQSFSLTGANRQALIVTSDRATGVGSGTGPVHTVLAMEEGEVKVVYETDIKAGFNVESGLAIFDEPHFAETDPLCCPSGRRITKVGLDQATGQVRVLDERIVPISP